MVAHAETRDIYELLGIDSGASTTLAQDVYWRRVNAYLDADRAGDPEARAAIAELNAALAIVLDRSRRAEYDRERGREHGAASGSSDPLADSGARARRRTLVFIGLVPLVGLAMWFALSAGTLVAVGTGLLGAAVIVFAEHWANKEIVAGMSPYRVLHLRDGATLEDVQAAYQAEVGRLRFRARLDRNAVRDLDALDKAYLRATDLIARGELPVPPSMPQRLTGRFDGSFARGVGGFAHGLFALSMLGVRGLTVVGRRLSGLAGSAASSGWRSPARRSPAGRAAERDAEVEERLDSAFREVTKRIAVTPPHSEVAAKSVPTTRAALVLESAAGRRSVPLSGVPLRIGSDGACDLVLRQDGVMPEHAMAWVRDGSIVLHVIHQYASCLVNGEPTTWAMLDDGDEVRFGEAKVRVSI